MSFMRTLPGTGLTVSALGLGTVKLGRNTQVKYPASFTLPDDAAVRTLLTQAHALGINLLESDALTLGVVQVTLTSVARIPA